jgi:secreted trypsin-like serine protease
MFWILVLVFVAQQQQQVLTITYSCDPNASCGCSTSPATVSRILGGETALNNTWGWVVSILFNNSYYCAGSLISDSWILTTVNCVRSYRPSEILVSAATNQRFGWKQRRYASVVIKHPNYDSQTQVNDIALIRVSSLFNMADASIAQICLPMMTITAEDYPPINSPVRKRLSCPT